MCNNCIHKAVCSIYRATGGVKKCEHFKEERRGRWYDVALRYTEVKEECSVCHSVVRVHGFRYCPNCGADMRGAEDG